MTRSHLYLSIPLFAALSAVAQEQTPAQPAPAQPGQTEVAPPPPDKRIFGVLPNYRTANETAVYTPISAKHKFVIGLKDSFDYPLLGLAAVIAAEQQWSNTNPSF